MRTVVPLQEESVLQRPPPEPNPPHPSLLNEDNVDPETTARPPPEPDPPDLLRSVSNELPEKVIAAKAWVDNTAAGINHRNSSSDAPHASVMDEKQHMLEYLVENYARLGDTVHEEYANNIHAALDCDMNMDEYRGVFTVAADMPQVVGVDGNRVIVKKISTDTADGGMSDTGANISVTNDLSQLEKAVPIKPFSLQLAEEKDESNSAMCTYRGLYPLIDTRTGSVEYTPMYFNAAVTGTIISPACVLRNSDVYVSCTQTLHRDGRPGTLRFDSESGLASLTILLEKKNDLYYIPTPDYRVCPDYPVVMNAMDAVTQAPLNTDDRYVPPTVAKARTTTPVTPRQQVESELWAARLGQCSEDQLDVITSAVEGLPKKFHYHPFRYIDYKEDARVQKQPRNKTAVRLAEAGRGFFMDFAFMRASSVNYTKSKVKEDRIVASFDGFNSHLIIVDEASSFVWVFLLKSKEPPTTLVVDFLKMYGHKGGGLVRTDQGGELARSDEFCDKVYKECNYVVERTGSDSPSQNGGAETMNKPLAVTTRALLYGADLPPQFWSVALVHAVYLHNRRVHSRTKITPYEGWYGKKPNLKYLRLFGARVAVKKTGPRPAKLDKHSFHGIFLGYSATDQNIIYLDLNTGRVLTSHHATFNEAWYLFPKRPPAAQLLYELGQRQEEFEITTEMMMNPVPSPAPVPPLNWQAQQKMPLKDVGEVMNIPLPLQWEQSTNYAIGAAAASIDGGCYKDTVLDTSKFSALFEKYDISKRDVLQVYMSTDPYADEFTRTIDLKGYTTSSHPAAGLSLVTKEKRLILQHIQPGTNAAKLSRWRSECKGAWLKAVDGKPVESLEQVHAAFAQLLTEKRLTCELTLSHPEIRHGLAESGIPQVNLDQMNPRQHLLGPAILPPIIKQAPPPPCYDHEGDVLIGGLPTVNKLTRGKLLQADDWDEWEKSEWQQLDQYEAQGMFGEVVKIAEVVKNSEKKFGHRDRGKLPVGIFRLVWTYAKKLAGDVKVRRKSRAAIDGSPRAGQAEIIGPTFANCADQTASRLFYAITAAENNLLFGADVSNAFAEAPGPDKNFYIKPDQAFHNWWVNCKKRPPIQPDEVIIGIKAFQGHPEAARAWDKHSDKILRQIGFTPTTHEPCLYSGVIDNERVLFLRQVDDFAIAAPNERIANMVLDGIDEHLTFPIKRLGLLKLFNGVDIDQTDEYIKISVETYLTKIMEKHIKEWQNLPDDVPLAALATPLPTKKRFLESFLSAEGDRLEDGKPDLQYQRKLEGELKISYRSAIGEIIWAMTTCRPDVSHAAVKCSQFSSCPHKIHYHGVRHLLKYLNQTKTDGIYFWRAERRTDLPRKPRPVINSNINELLMEKRREFGPQELHALADSDWANCPKTRRSYTGVLVRLAGGTISWKTRLQEVVALSSAEAELMAATDAGKMILYIRSILWDLGIPQMAATVIGEDNDACTAIGNAQKTTPRTRHLDIRYRALSDWIERDLMLLERVDTSVNTSDHLTKLLGRVLFHRHNDYLLGHVPPQYSQAYSDLFHPVTGSDLSSKWDNKQYDSYNTPHFKDKVGDKVIKSLVAKWDLLCHLVEG